MANKRITKILILLSVMFLSLIGYLTYIELFEHDFLVNNAYNQRQWDDESGTVRGKICDANGKVLAKSEDGVRKYPYKNMYAHIIGYNSRTYGRINIERTYNDYLLGKNKISNIIGASKGENGYNVNLTIDHDIQEYAYNLLKGNGSVIAIDPKTGGIIAMVSKPDFDPNDEELVKNWSTLADSEDSPFLARATSGMYAPGSTFKLLTSLCAIENGYENDEYDDEGKVEIGGSTFENQNTKAYGHIDMTRGFAVSSNVVFCSLGAKIGGEKLCGVAERFGFNKETDFDIYCAKSYFPTDEKNKEKSAALAIGQGDILATPMQMAMVTCGIANKGVIMKPHLVGSITDNNGNVVRNERISELYDCADSVDTEKVTDMMVETVKSGTGTNASISGITVAGKTGTAENEQTVGQKGKEHTWFLAFAPAYDPQIAVVVMMEYSGGSGGGNCAPVARNIISKYLSK